MDTYAIIGLGRFGYRLAGKLAQAGAEVIAVDRRQEVVDSIREQVTLAVCLESTDEQALLAQGLHKVDVAVVGIGTDFEANVLTTLILKQLGVPRVISRATDSTTSEILRRVGADALVSPEDESAHRWAQRLLGPNVIEQVPIAEGHSIVQIPVPTGWVGKSLAELDVRRKYEVNVVAIRHDVAGGTAGADQAAAAQQAASDPKQPRPEPLSIPLPHSKLQTSDVLVIVGADDKIMQLPRD